MSDVSLFFNPNHDDRGRFSTGGGGGFFGRKKRPAAPKYSPQFTGSDRLKAQQRLLMTASKIRQGLTPGETIALRDYMTTFQGSQAINHALQGRAKIEWDTGKPQTSQYQEQTTLKSAHEFEAIFEKTPLNATPLQLVRGIGSVPRTWGRTGSLEGLTLSADGLTSTTMEISYATFAAKTTAGMKGKEGGSVLMVLHVPENTVRALPASDILHGTAKNRGLKPPPPGHEVILPPGTRIKVHNDEPMTPEMQPPGAEGGKQVFDRIVRVEVLPEDPNYRQAFSARDAKLSELLDTVSLFFNPNHDARGRFSSGPGGSRFGKAGPPKNKAEKELDDLIAGIRKKNEGLKHLRDVHDHYSRIGAVSDATMEAVRYYEGSFARNGAMNDILRHGKIREKHWAEEVPTTGEAKVREHVENLQKEFDVAPRLKKDTTVYRALRNVPASWTTTVTRQEIEALQEKRFQAKKAKDMDTVSKIDTQLDPMMKAYQSGGAASLAGKVVKDEGFVSTTAELSRANGYMALAQGGKPAMLHLTLPKGTPVIPVNTIIGKEGGPQAELLLKNGTAFKITGDTIKDGERVITGEVVTVSRETSFADHPLMPIIALFMNPYHDERGRFASSPHGSVMKPDGGFTFDPTSGRMASTGYAVSPYPERSKVIDVDNLKPKEIRAAVTEYVTSNMDLAEQENHYVGGWRDPQPGGKVYLDVSIVVKDQEEARRLALKHDQIAFFDFSTFQSVQVDANAKSGQK